jgi:crossover junction endodeoxyribonuclease RuvC
VRILGIDPGLRVTGFGIIERHGQQDHYIASGAIHSGERLLPERLKVLADGIAEVVRQYQPQQAAVEQVFVNVNPRSTLLLGQARGALLLALIQQQLPIYEYTALQVKRAVVGNGHADKIQVQAMVQRLLRLSGTPQADAADALACALCHVQHGSGSLGKLTLRSGLSLKAGRLK